MKNITIILTVVVIVTAGMLSFLWFSPQVFIYKLTGAEGLHEHMTKTREYGIKMAHERGEYNCCIEPDCTMCYSEGNKWNYGKAGTCACDDFIARGEEPCPQCARALSCGSESKDEEGNSEELETCVIDLEEL